MKGIENVSRLLLYYDALDKKTQEKIQACDLDLSHAIKRCENLHGIGSCLKITPTFVNKKCQAGFKI